ncbi:MAG: hypothetical protein D6714_12845 [Bacteroidetes bacterium]|nr:MAG: hypothetical protein D6714_12845 [Bacteroidota bacterium]
MHKFVLFRLVINNLLQKRDFVFTFVLCSCLAVRHDFKTLILAPCLGNMGTKSGILQALRI